MNPNITFLKKSNQKYDTPDIDKKRKINFRFSKVRNKNIFLFTGGFFVWFPFYIFYSIKRKMKL